MNIPSFIKKVWPVLVIIALWFLFSAPYFLKGFVPFPSDYLVTFFPPWNASYGMPVKNNAMPDVITQIYPWKKLTIELWKQGIVPLWNPYSFSGTVHAGNYQSAVFSPINLLFFLFSFVDAWSVMILLQPLLGGIGMYLFLREIGISKVGRTIGAIGFMFSGFMTTWMAYGTLGYAILPLPFMLFAIERYMKKGGWWELGIIPLLTWFSFVSGHFQISLYCLFCALAYSIFAMWCYKQWKKGIPILFAFLFGLGIAAPQLFLTFDAFQQSSRASNTLAKEVIPWQYMLTLFAPDFYGNPVTRNDWFGHYAEWASYIGIVPLLLGLFALFYSKEKKRFFFIFLGITALLLAYQSPLSYLLFFLKIPILSTSAASRIIVLFSFCLTVLSGIGFDALSMVWKKGTWKSVVWFIVGIGSIGMALWVLLLFFPWLSSEKLVVAKRNYILPTMFLLGTCGCILIGFFRRKYSIFVIASLFILLSAFDMYRYATKWMPFEPKEYMYPETKTLSFLTKQNAYDRTFGTFGGEVGNYFHIGLIDGYDAMYQERYGEFINAFSRGDHVPAGRSVVVVDKYGDYTSFGLQLLGVRYIAHRKSDGRNVWAFPFWQYKEGEMQKVFEDEHYEIYEYTKAYPRAFLASSYVVETNKEDILHTLFTTHARETVVLEKHPDISPQEGEGDAVIQSYRPGSMEISVQTTVPKILFISDAYHTSWEAYIDGKKSTVYRADYDFLGIPVPAGAHNIELRYAPSFFRWGIMIAFASVAGTVLLIFVRKKL